MHKNASRKRREFQVGSLACFCVTLIKVLMSSMYFLMYKNSKPTILAIVSCEAFHKLLS